jgi:PKD domain
VTTFARSLFPLSAPRPLRRPILLGGLVAALSTALLLSAAPAAAVVTTVGSATVGLAPRISPGYLEEGVPKSYANPAGNPVLHGTGVYAIYWDPTDHYWSEWQNAIDTYLQSAAAASGSLTSVFDVDSQYTDKSNSPASYAQTFKGAYTDIHAYPVSGCDDPNPFALEDQIERELGGAPTAVCLTSAQMASELEAFIALHSLPRGLGDVYYLLTPPGVTVCLDGGGVAGHCSDYLGGSEESYDNSFCSYHADINPGGLPTGAANTIVYAVIPWTAGGYGDGDLLEADQRPGWECQDGGINPDGENGGYEVEAKKEKNEKEKNEFKEKDKREKAKIERAETLEGPHEEEPNQEVPCPDTDGTCDYGLSDLIINQISLQQEDMVTDPLLNAWQDEDHYENTDECRFLFGPVLGGSVTANEESDAGTLYDQSLTGHNYYLNDAFSLAALRLPYPGVPCVHGVNLDPKFTAPTPVNSGEIVGFNGMESDISLDAAIGYSAGGAPQPNYATYTWNFGDGTPEVSGYAPGAPVCEAPLLSPCAASVFHSYQYGGIYEVTLTVRDVGGNTASITHTVTVDGPPRPSAGGGQGSSAGSVGQTTQGSGSSGSGVVAAPVAAATIVRQTLRNALRKGLVVSYSVNEQVAGHFEVLLSSAVAHRLGISGTPAVGLPAGSPAELVIAKAILVTTKGGHSAVHIQFSKRTAARLAHVHKVSLMLRLIVRNAASSNPATTTVVSSVTLTG